MKLKFASEFRLIHKTTERRKMTILNYDYSEEHQDQVNNQAEEYQDQVNNQADDEAEHQPNKKRRRNRKKNNKPTKQNNQVEENHEKAGEKQESIKEIQRFYKKHLNHYFSEDTIREVQRLMEIVKNHPITINGEFPVNFHTRLYSQEIIQISNIFGKRYHEKNQQDYNELINFLKEKKTIITLIR